MNNGQFTSKVDQLTERRRRQKLYKRKQRKKHLLKKENRIKDAVSKLLEKIKESKQMAGTTKASPLLITNKRLTRKVGIYKQGKKSATILRDANEELQARSDQDLRKILDLASTAAARTGKEADNLESSVSLPLQLMPVQDPKNRLAGIARTDYAERQCHFEESPFVRRDGVNHNVMQQILDKVQEPLARKNKILFRDKDLKKELKQELQRYLCPRNPKDTDEEEGFLASNEGSIVFSTRSQVVSRSKTRSSSSAYYQDRHARHHCCRKRDMESTSYTTVTIDSPSLSDPEALDLHHHHRHHPPPDPANNTCALPSSSATLMSTPHSPALSPIIKWSFVPDESFLYAQGDHLADSWSPEKSLFSPSLLESAFSPFCTKRDDKKFIAEYFVDKKEIQQPFSLESSTSNSAESTEESPNWSHIPLTSPPALSTLAISPPNSPWRYPRRKMY